MPDSWRIALVDRLLCASHAGIVYCDDGQANSLDAAMKLTNELCKVRIVEGGLRVAAGIIANIRTRPDLGANGRELSRRITRVHRKIGRVAFPWLIQRFIDQNASFMYAPAGDMFETARKTGAIPYDIDRALLAHGLERCCFDCLLSAFDRQLPALDLPARVVRGADLGMPGLIVESTGLLTGSAGLSTLHSNHDSPCWTLRWMSSMLSMHRPACGNRGNGIDPLGLTADPMRVN